jgi:hypothetical protein
MRVGQEEQYACSSEEMNNMALQLKTYQRREKQLRTDLITENKKNRGRVYTFYKSKRGQYFV